MEQEGEASRPLHECANGRTLKAEDQIAFPVPGHGPIGDFRWPLADHDVGANEAFASTAAPGSRYAQRPPGAQAGGELPAERAPSLHVQRLENGLVADTHGRIVRELERKPMRNLLRAPGPAPAAMLATATSSARPRHGGATHRRAVGRGDHPG